MRPPGWVDLRVEWARADAAGRALAATVITLLALGAVGIVARPGSLPLLVATLGLVLWLEIGPPTIARLLRAAESRDGQAARAYFAAVICCFVVLALLAAAIPVLLLVEAIG